MPEVIVIGAGIVGASVAYRLSQAGASVTVLEAVRLAIGTSSNSFAWVNANEKTPRPYYELNAAGLAEHHQLADELPDSGFHPSGQVEWAVEPGRREHLRQKVSRLQSWGYRAELIDRQRAQALLPDLVLPALDAADYAFFPAEGWVAVPVLIHRLLAAAARAGARVMAPAPVERLLTEGQQVIGVATAEATFRADMVVDCSGTAAGTLLAALGLTVARQRSPGLLAITEPAPVGLKLVVHTPGVYFRPDGGGRLRIGSTEVDARLAEAPPDGGGLITQPVLSAELLRRAQAVVPGLAGVQVESVRLGWRPMPGDGLSAVGAAPGIDGYYLVFTHSGVTLGPLLGRLAAEEIIGGREQPLLAPFRPNRLVTA